MCSCRLDNSSPAHGRREASAPPGGRIPTALLAKYADEQHTDAFEQLTRAARMVGVTIARSGAFPQEGTESAQLAEAAAHECLTNLVRHAGGAAGNS